MTDAPIRPFVFSCDAHIAEPNDLFEQRMPAHLAAHTIRFKQEDGKRLMCVGDTVLMRMFNDFPTHKTGMTDETFALQSGGSLVDTKRRGTRDLALRAADMDRDGVDAELVFPTMGLMLPRIADREGQRVACAIWNDWAWDYTAPMRDRLIPAAMIPCIDFDDARDEVKRVVAKGFAEPIPAYAVREEAASPTTARKVFQWERLGMRVLIDLDRLPSADRAAAAVELREMADRLH